VLQHDVEIVEQPFTSRTDVDLSLCSSGQSIMHFAQDPASIVQSLEQRAMASLFLRWQQPVLARDVARMLRKPVSSEDFTANRTYELPVPVVIRQTEKPKNPAA
jgi:hypothetical protein